jgi:hypothetical protein
VYLNPNQAGGAKGFPSVAERMGSVNVFGMVLLVGPALRAAREHLRATVMRRGTFRDQRGGGLRPNGSPDAALDGSASGGSAFGGEKRARSDGAEEEEAATPHFPVLCSASDVWVAGGDEHTAPGATGAEVGAPALVLRFATATTEEAHDALLAALAPLKLTLGRIPFGPIAV